jgi:hypothetical protein
MVAVGEIVEMEAPVAMEATGRMQADSQPDFLLVAMAEMGETVVIGGSAEIEGMVDRVATEEMEVCPATADVAVVAVMVVVVEIVVANKVPMRKTTKDLHLLNYINLAHFSKL